MTKAADIFSKEQIEFAAQWWANSLKSPSKDNGDDSAEGLFTSLVSTMLVIEPSKEQIESFKAALIALIETETVYGNELVLYTDYDPEGILRSAAQMAGVNASAFSWKTRMSITPHEISVMAGYKSHWKTIWTVAE